MGKSGFLTSCGELSDDGADYLAFCVWGPQDAWCERMSATFDLR